jgi:hypothetical protein
MVIKNGERSELCIGCGVGNRGIVAQNLFDDSALFV